LYAIGGGKLNGDKLVRILYLDESGTGKIAREPYLVIAGVLVDGDGQWLPLKKHLQSLLEGAVPAGQPMPSYLHAADIYHGSGEFPRGHWPRDLRLELLDNVARIPSQFHLPVVWGLKDRAAHEKQFPNDTQLQRLIDCYTIATTNVYIANRRFLCVYIQESGK
jgi:hypothetical protein